MQIIPHTRLIKSFGRFFEIFINSPSHHRVHHGTNPQYRDKNFAGVLIIWDRLFKTFEPEVEEVNYGVLNGPKSWNPVVINFHFWKTLLQHCMTTRSTIDKFKVWLKPIGWAPSDIKIKNNDLKSKNYHKKFQTIA